MKIRNPYVQHLRHRPSGPMRDHRQEIRDQAAEREVLVEQIVEKEPAEELKEIEVLEEKPFAVKQAIVIRKDLRMRRGKEIAQGAHASIAWLTSRMQGSSLPREAIFVEVELSSEERAWVEGRFTKIVLQVDSEIALREVYEQAQKARLEAYLIIDRGATEFHGVPTPTCVGIGPDRVERIDAVVRHLKLY